MIRSHGDSSLNTWVHLKDKHKIHHNDPIKSTMIHVERERERGSLVYFCYSFIDGDAK